jgi:hypothetical protein
LGLSPNRHDGNRDRPFSVPLVAVALGRLVIVLNGPLPDRTVSVACLFGILIGTVGVVCHGQESTAVDFQRDVLPLLSDRCFLCHGPDDTDNESGLRLDLQESAFDESPSGDGHAIVPGSLEESQLIQRITSDDPDERMPPKDSGRKPLNGDEIAILKSWVSSGAKYESLWSWNPVPRQIEIPKVEDSKWVRNEIDAFVLANLESKALRPNGEAERWRWLRRVTLDLTGLPPSQRDLDDFENDRSENAYETVVDRLLNSRAFGEHMAVSWLDAVRYADSYGYQSDQLCTVWPYRDWVVRAFNQNLPYDQFLKWQLAGDLLPEPTVDQRIATAFNRLHRQTNEGGSIDLEWRTEYAADRVNTFGTAMLGLTLGCARCHDHKFDAVTQRDYYQFMSFFNNIDEYGLYNNTPWVPTPSLLLPNQAQQEAAERIDAEIASCRQQMAEAATGAIDRFQTWQMEPFQSELPEPRVYLDFATRDAENRFPGPGPEAVPFATTSAENVCVEDDGHTALKFSGDHRLEVEALPLTLFQPVTISFWIKVPDGLDEAILFHEQTGTDVGFSGPVLSIRNGRLFWAYVRFWPGNVLAVESRDVLPTNRWVHLAFTYDGTVDARQMKILVDGQLVSEVVRNKVYKNVHSSPKLHFGERFRSTGFKDGLMHSISIYDQALGTLEIEALRSGQSLGDLWDNSTEPQRLEFFQQRVDPSLAESRRQLRAAEQSRISNNDPMTELMVMEELDGETPTHVLHRGDYDAPRTDENRVGRDTPRGFFPFPDDSPRNRLGLAEWLTHPDHPLGSRVAVNRVWSNFFQDGLVATQGDFGVQGQRPTHPELLDWLARDFMNHSWDVKRLCRQIVLSATYRQDSRATAEQLELDPRNEWLARGPTSRLSAEEMRDMFLSVGGLLKERSEGPPVSPYQPAGLWRESNSMSPAYHESTGDDPFRRSLYSVWKRTAPLPNMIAFDAANREVCTVQRSATSTPVQALVTLNDPQFVEAACHLANAAERAAGIDSITDRLDWMFRQVTSRHPDEHESRILESLYEEQLAEFGQREDASTKLLSVGSKLIAVADRPKNALDELAALTMAAQAILNLDAAQIKR